jgi:hypothetical protein
MKVIRLWLAMDTIDSGNWFLNWICQLEGNIVKSDILSNQMKEDPRFDSIERSACLGRVVVQLDQHRLWLLMWNHVNTFAWFWRWRKVSLSWPGMTWPLVIRSRCFRRCVLRNQEGWSRDNQPCGMPSRHYKHELSQLPCQYQKEDRAPDTYVLNYVAMVANEEECSSV